MEGVAMKRLLFLLAFILQGGGDPIVIPIPNASFEQGTTGWTFDVGSRIFDPASETSPTPGEPFPPAPDGAIVALVGTNPVVSDPIAIPTRPSGIYTLRFYAANFFYWYPGQYTVSVSLDSFYETLCTTSGHALGDFAQITLVCPVRDQPATNLRISFTGSVAPTFWPTFFDKFSLTFTPQ
jgi:hypothetical protein